MIVQINTKATITGHKTGQTKIINEDYLLKGGGKSADGITYLNKAETDFRL